MNYYVTRKAGNAPVTIWRSFHRKTLAQAEADKMRKLEPKNRWGVYQNLRMIQICEERSDEQ